ncbi:MAG: hypothetical protein KGR48_04680 [Alphaproteobacteria bacterium]|nr:hypothetical protein [Alphaproteobacteria bacterium]MDE2014554.1 hypothetical protein [Alphaproteobacteria bacterium]MDE2074770.1 hypothetical protein [Alphaproteobacteria bacterium]MDE2352882.1 hypothetical protein [Alphaproteobacteria bacterium]
MMRARAALFALVLCSPAAAQENNDLNRIPQAVLNAPAAQSAPVARAHGKYFLEDDLSATFVQGDLAVASPIEPSHWGNRTSLDAFDRWPLGHNIAFVFSDRFDLSEADGIGFPAGAARNDLREAYLSWEPLPQTYLDFGRINLKNGIALGFNPTDFFRARTGVSQSSADPSALRENRLGTVMVRAQTIWNGGSASFAYAPRLAGARPLAGPRPGWVDPLFDQTNCTDRFLFGLNLDLGDLSTQALLFHGGSRTRLGLDLSYPIGRSVIAYGEWSGGRDTGLTARAIAFGQATGTLPAGAPLLPPGATARRFLSDLAVGASWSSEAKVTLNLEYHFHQAGFSGGDWRNWFAAGAADPALAPELWYIRAYASDAQEPMSRQQIFLRADWQDAPVNDLELSGIAFVNAEDGSSMVQLAADYNLDNNWTVSAYAGSDFGGAQSEWGSLPEAGSIVFQVDRYF